MNQKDYKAIGEIIKIRLDKLNKQETAYDHEKHSRLCRIDELEEMAKSLADYFEKEDKLLIEKKKKWDKGDNDMSIKELEDVFNRKQFLKWCGVKE